jgi:hypothetical protein
VRQRSGQSRTSSGLCCGCGAWAGAPPAVLLPESAGMPVAAALAGAAPSPLPKTAPGVRFRPSQKPSSSSDRSMSRSWGFCPLSSADRHERT